MGVHVGPGPCRSSSSPPPLFALPLPFRGGGAPSLQPKSSRPQPPGPRPTRPPRCSAQCCLPALQRARISDTRPSVPPTLRGRSTSCGAQVSGLPVSGPPNHCAPISFETRRVRSRSLIGAADSVPQSAPAGWDWCGDRSMASAAGWSPPRAWSGLRFGAAPRQLQAFPGSGFRAPGVRGHRGTPRVPVGTEAGSKVAVDLGG
ncbi:hypothetical protein NDU88_000924 [Pleurodeles waltl]|uniref:Uncharacterized protein n=1 Tax=Pleurodeles waltl TaxID=8319 RepID=A0AAV7Q1P5_PLEWA|nr:hypothetical protein NDU88_000924 [Pleurodeles waltl]